MTPELAAAWEKKSETGVGGTIGTAAPSPAAAPGAPLGFELGAMAPEAISPFVVFLCTDEAADINGCNFLVCGGEVHLYSEPQQVKSIYKKGIWTVDELCEIVPTSLGAGLVNPSPPAAPKT